MTKPIDVNTQREIDALLNEQDYQDGYLEHDDPYVEDEDRWQAENDQYYGYEPWHLDRNYW